LEAEAEQRCRTLTPKVVLAREELEEPREEFKPDLYNLFNVAEAALRLQKLETEVAKAELDLALARRELERRRIGR